MRKYPMYFLIMMCGMVLDIIVHNGVLCNYFSMYVEFQLIAVIAYLAVVAYVYVLYF